MFFVTTLPPAITAPSPIITPEVIKQFPPIHTSLPIVILEWLSPEMGKGSPIDGIV